MNKVTTAAIIDFRFINVTNTSYETEKFIKVEGVTFNDAAKAAHIKYQLNWNDGNGTLPTLFKLVTGEGTGFYNIDPVTGETTSA